MTNIPQPPDTEKKDNAVNGRPIEDNRYSSNGSVQADNIGRLRASEKDGKKPQHQRSGAAHRAPLKDDELYGENRVVREGSSVGGRMGE